MKKYLNHLLLLTLLVIYVVCLSPFKNYITDDTYIFLQFTKNLVHLGEFSFNPGSPTYGITSPLWVLLTALINKATNLNLATIITTQSKVFGLLTVYLLYFLAFKLSKSSLIAFLASLLMIFDIWFLRWAASGMETSATMFFSLLTIYCYMTEREKSTNNIISSVLSAICVLLRPECFILFMAILADQWINRKNILNNVLIFVLLLLPWNIYAYSVFGTIIPNTVLAKIGQSYFISVKQTTLILFGSYPIQIAILLVTALIYRKEIDLNKHIFLFLWPSGLILFYIAGKSDVLTRYLLPIAPIIILVGLLALNRLINRFLLTTTAIFIIIFNITVFANLVYPHVYNTSHYNVENTYKYIGKWLNKNTKKDAVVATAEIGAIGYYADRTIIDTLALITPEMIPYLKSSKTMDYIREKQPDYYVGGDEIVEALGNKAEFLFKRAYKAGRARDPKDLEAAKAVYKLNW